MKVSSRIPFTGRIITLLSALSLTSLSFGQGSLTPPGPPEPTFKTLQQVEPRKPISGATNTVTISQSGSYYLTGNITVAAGNGIVIAANNVTLDLNGFTISSTEASPSGTGILLSNGRRHVHILNGHIKGNVTLNGGVYSGSGFANGIHFSGADPSNVRVSGVSVSGCQVYGIVLLLTTFNATVVESCTVKTVGSFGIVANSVSSSTSTECSDGIISVTADNSFGEATDSGNGLNASSANNCVGISVSGRGITVTTATGCRGISSSGLGVFANVANGTFGSSSNNLGLTATTAVGCYGTSMDGTGLNATVATGCYGQSSTSIGVEAGAANNCSGFTGPTGIGLRSSSTAIGCRGSSNGSGTGLESQIAIGCIGSSSTGTGMSAGIANSCAASGTPAFSPGTQKFDMPP